MSTAPALAQHGAPSVEAEARFQEASNLRKQGRFDDALAKYVQSYSLEPRASTLLGIALSERELGRFPEATRHLREYMKNPRAQNVEDLKRTVFVPLLEQSGHLHVKMPSGVQLTVNEMLVAPIDDVVDVKPGPHVLFAMGQRREVVVAKGQTLEVDLTPPREVSDPKSPAPLPIEPPREEPQSSSARWIVPVGLGVGFAVGIGFGIGFSQAHKSTLEEADATRAASSGNICADPESGACAGYRDKLSTASTQATLAWVSYGLGIALGVGSLASILLWPKAPKTGTGQGQIMPILGPGTGGVYFSRSF